MQKIILFYKFVPLLDPKMTMRWQHELCTRLALQGRIIVAAHGINGTLGGELNDLKTYINTMNRTSEFKDIDYKFSDGGRDDFPRLSVKVRKELVTLDPDEEFDVFDRGIPLDPKAWRNYINAHPNVTILDARNYYESEIGAFQKAIKPRTRTFKDIKPELEKLPKDEPILTYCTGDIRCEYLTAYMKHKGFRDVYHLDGGIIRYGEVFGDDAYWRGKCYVFDQRMHIAFSDASVDIGVCDTCGMPTSNQVNCAKVQCNKRLLRCESCVNRQPLCTKACVRTAKATITSR